MVLRKMEDEKNEKIRDNMRDCGALTGLSYDYVVGNSSSMFVSRRALVHPLVVISLLPADVHHQCPRVRPHDHVDVLVNVEMRPISRPRETEMIKH